MFKRLFVLVGLVSGWSLILAQETIITDSGWIAPFKGILEYQVSYSGEAAEGKAEYLPDSLTVVMDEYGIEMEYHGGLVPQLGSRLFWDVKDGNLYSLLTGPQKNTRYVMPQNRIPSLPTEFKALRDKKTISGKSCKGYQYIEKTEDWTETTEIWVFDSIRYYANLPDSMLAYKPIICGDRQGRIPLKIIRTRMLKGRKLDYKVTSTVRTIRPEYLSGLSSMPERTDTFNFRIFKHPLLSDPRK